HLRPGDDPVAHRLQGYGLAVRADWEHRGVLVAGGGDRQGARDGMTISIKANRAYPSLPAPGSSLEAHTRLLEALKEAVEIHERRIPNAYLDSFVRLRELVELGLLEVRGGQITSAVEAGGGGAVVSTQLRGATWTRGGETLTTPANDVLLYFPQAAKIHGITL